MDDLFRIFGMVYFAIGFAGGGLGIYANKLSKNATSEADTRRAGYLVIIGVIAFLAGGAGVFALFVSGLVVPVLIPEGWHGVGFILVQCSVAWYASKPLRKIWKQETDALELTGAPASPLLPERPIEPDSDDVSDGLEWTEGAAPSESVISLREWLTKEEQRPAEAARRSALPWFGMFVALFFLNAVVRLGSWLDLIALFSLFGGAAKLFKAQIQNRNRMPPRAPFEIKLSSGSPRASEEFGVGVKSNRIRRATRVRAMLVHLRIRGDEGAKGFALESVHRLLDEPHHGAASWRGKLRLPDAASEEAEDSATTNRFCYLLFCFSGGGRVAADGIVVSNLQKALPAPEKP